MTEAAVADTRRLNSKPQDLTDAYGPPSNFLEIDIFNPQTVGVGRARYTSYELRMRVRAGGGAWAGAGRGRGAERRPADSDSGRRGGFRWGKTVSPDAAGRRARRRWSGWALQLVSVKCPHNRRYSIIIYLNFYLFICKPLCERLPLKRGVR